MDFSVSLWQTPLSNYSSASSFVWLPYCIFWMLGFNKLFYLLNVTAQTLLALIAAVFNFLTCYLQEGEDGTRRGEVTKTTEHTDLLLRLLLLILSLCT